MRRTIGIACLALAGCAPPAVATPSGDDVRVVTPDDAPLAPVEVFSGSAPALLPASPTREERRGVAAPVSGGTLLLTRRGLLVAGDEPTRRLYVVDPNLARVTGVVELAATEVPGRMAEDAGGILHVVTSEGVLRVDVATPRVLDRSRPCAAPRGVAHDGERDVVHVACAGGSLITLTPTHEVVRTVMLPPDLRDVVAAPGRIFVSRFRSAEVLVLDADGVPITTARPPSEVFTGVEPPAEMVPRVAWRMRARPGGGVVVAHQHQVSTDLGPLTDATPEGGTTYRAEPRRGVPAAVLEHRVSSFDVNGALVQSVPTTRQTLLVDAAAWSGGVIGAWAGPTVGPMQVAVEPISGDRFAILYQSTQVLLSIHLRGRAIDDVVRRPQDLVALDPGQQVFHSGSSVGIACASCHPGAHEDGHTWVTPEDGARRSQSLLGGLRGTEPFHWGGELADFDAIMEAQSRRLLRSFSTWDRAAALDWLDALPSTPAAHAPSPEAEAAFGAAGCASCHAGPRLSDERGHDVGMGSIQTPRLAAVLQRGPWLHDGCARSLEETIDGTCRPIDAHGVADPAARALVVAYLEAL